MSQAHRMDMKGPEASAFYAYMAAQPSIPETESEWEAASETLNRKWPNCTGAALTWAHRYQMLACMNRVDRGAYLEFAREIARCRTAQSWTQQDLARKVGMEVSYFSRLVRAQAEWTASELTALRQALPSLKVPRAIAEAASWLDPAIVPQRASEPIAHATTSLKQQTLPLTTGDVKLNRVVEILDIAIANGTALSVDRLRTLRLYLTNYDPTLALIEDLRKGGEA